MVASPAAVSRLPDGGRFVALDSWRGIAALCVVFHHVKGTAPFLTGPVHDNLSAAVDFFFVLSGFVISGAYGERLRQGFSILPYMVLRIGRVWPLHALMVGGYLALEILYAIWGGGGGEGRRPFTGERDPLTLPATLLLLQAYFYPTRSLWNVQSWSISVEAGLYLAAACLWRFAGRAADAIAVLAALVALVMLAWPIAGDWSSVLRGIGGFGLGIATYSLWPRFKDVRLSARAIAALELALPVAALIALASETPLLFVDALFTALVLVFAGDRGPVSRVLRSSPCVWLGVLSYSLYMVHGMVIGRAFDALAVLQRSAGQHWVVARIGGSDLLLLPPVAAALVTVGMMALSLGAAWLAWRLVEWPARQWSRRRAARLGVGRQEERAPTL